MLQLLFQYTYPHRSSLEKEKENIKLRTIITFKDVSSMWKKNTHFSHYHK